MILNFLPSYGHLPLLTEAIGQILSRTLKYISHFLSYD